MNATKHEVGSLVRARGRDWVVQPESYQIDDLIVLQPLDGSLHTSIAVDAALEDVVSSSFSLPKAQNADGADVKNNIGSLEQAVLLRDAVKLSFRNAAGPFRCLSRIGVEPRPYQLVPLMMALRQETVRLLISDDVGIGKTVESLLIARELHDRGEISGFTVLCPPHLAEQWRDALQEQFGYSEVTLVLSSTAKRLEKELSDGDDSIFKQHPITVVSMDFIKQPNRRDSFIRTCPQLVIVDEAHGAAKREGTNRNAQKRHELLQELASNDEQHLILVTATPHSGHQDAFASLVSLLDPQFYDIAINEHPSENDKRKLAKHIVQRRRPDIRRDFNDMGATFPDRVESTREYSVNKEQKQLIDDIVDWGLGRISAVDGDKRKQRVRTWSMLGLLRAIASSPNAALAGLKTRAESLENEEEISKKHASLDIRVFDRSTEQGIIDEVAGADELLDGTSTEIVNDFITRFSQVDPAKDEKVIALKQGLQNMLKDGFNPIVFCRFVPTVDMLVTILQNDKKFKNIHIEGLTGRLNPDERIRRIEQLTPLGDVQKIMIATDCLAEGINLQDNFNAVIHYDLSWSPTTHEQREGRVDRFGQNSPEVRALSLVGLNNRIDAYVARIIIEKQRTIRASLGISVPAPDAAKAISQAITDGWLGQKPETTRQVRLFEFLDSEDAQRNMEEEWSNSAKNESKRRSRFSQATIDVTEVQQEVMSIREALGKPKDVHRFLVKALQANNIQPSINPDDLTLEFSTQSAPRQLFDSVQMNDEEKLAVVDDLSPVPPGWKRIVRTSKVVEQMANHVMGQTLDPKSNGRGRRLSVTRTNDVKERVFILLARGRFSLNQTYRSKQTSLLVESLVVLGFKGQIDRPQFLTEDEINDLWSVQPSGNVPGGQAEMILNQLIPKFKEPQFTSKIQEIMLAEGEQIRDAHQRVRSIVNKKLELEILPHHPIDLISLNVLLPGGGN